MRWLTRPRPQATTWGVPWARGTVGAGDGFALATADGRPVPVQSWVTARWPDGSVKWSAHAIGPQQDPAAGYTLTPTADPAPVEGPVVRVGESADGVVVDTGVVRWTIPTSGPLLVGSAERDGRTVVGPVELVSLWQGGPTPDAGGHVEREELRGLVEEVVVEQSGPLRAVVRLTGRHARPSAAATRGGRGAWLPFTVRLVLAAGSEELRVVHSLVWDGDADRDFLAGLGLRASVPMRDALHDRHVRLAGTAGGPGRDEEAVGFLTEAVRGLTGLRRDPGEQVRRAQVEGRPCPPVQEWAPEVSRRLELIPAWNDWTLDQTSADGYLLRKRTGAGRSWVTIPSGRRSAGYGYLGGAGGGLGFGLRNFWQQHPTRLDVRGAATATATATVWMWSPSAPAMDLRFYHDGLGQDDFASQLEGLEITYEDYEPGFGDAHGIARTSELTLRAHAATPTGAELSEHAAALGDPALLVCPPERLHAAGVFGDWSLVDRSTPARAAIEDRLDLLLDYYAGQVEQRRWYGFWDFGDVMHTYDHDRHQWRYDVGGYAWDNSELSPDLWLWYSFLRTGRADVFRLAEAMTRHTGEVDVYHAGRWKGLGTRHNVQHWGCSAKQLRISTAAYRRFFYYLTADERTGDLLDELAEPERTFTAIDPTRKVRTDVYTPDPSALAVGLGTDWSALAAAWLTRWERHGDTRARDRLLGTMTDIGSLPQGFLTGEALLDLETGRFDTSRDRVRVSHLSAVFGLVEICSELVALTAGTPEEAPGFEQAWLRYCRLYLAGPEAQQEAVGAPLSGISLIQAHSRLTAWAAARTGDAELARLAWHAFDIGDGDQLNTNPLQTMPWDVVTVTGHEVAEVVQEVRPVSTNDAAQYGLAAIQNLALVGEHLPG
nr:Tat pathway signal sequence domain protein [Auraticoccus cholistanensis]